MRIDEFSNAGNIDGSISVDEQTRFLLFGFDLLLDIIVVYDPPTSRTFLVDSESRIYLIAFDLRVYEIEQEKRLLTV